MPRNTSLDPATTSMELNGPPLFWPSRRRAAVARLAHSSGNSHDSEGTMKRPANIRMFIKGTLGPQILEELVRFESDAEIVKKRYSVFYGTNLDALLEELGMDSLVLAGVNTHACIRTAAIDAYQRDFDVKIVRECVASKDLMHHEITMDYLDGGIATVVTLGEIGKQFGVENASMGSS